MRFGKVPVDASVGAILAHTMRTPKKVFKKGRKLSRDDVDALLSAGHKAVVAARLDPGETDEDAAAAAIARGAAGAYARAAPPFTGRCNIYADEAGLAIIDRRRIDTINAVDEAVTIATVPPFAYVAAGEMIATVKIIPFGVPKAVVDDCVGAADGALGVAPFRPHDIALIQTRLAGTKESVLDRSADNMRVRVERLGSRIAAERRCDHDVPAVAAAISEVRERGCAPIVILGASAIADRGDVVPEAIRQAGGELERFGMPVDPGNLLLLGRRGDTSLVGVPGCARSLKRSGFDWVLERICVGLAPTAAEIGGMGVGGLLADIASRPQPRRAPVVSRRPLRVAAVVLAAGQSSRMGPRNKLLEEVAGVPMVVRVVDALRHSRAEPILVVTGHESDRVRAALADHPVDFVHNPNYITGMSSSLRAGVGALSDEVDAALICLGDMPWIRVEHVDALIDALDPAEGREICVPLHAGKRGNPVLFSARFFSEIMGLSGDVGARQIIADNDEVVRGVEIADTAVLVDVDTADALSALEGGEER